MNKNNKIPQHVAIIPDGNRRWAKEKGLSTFEGHRRGYDLTIELGKKAREIGIKILTFWAFSTENWNRSSEEVSYLMKLYEQMIDKNLKIARKEEIQIIHIGRKDRISEKLRNKMIRAEEETKDYKKYILVIALDYGGRDEIVRAVQKIIASSKKSEEINKKTFSEYLDTHSLPDPDIIIRTSGEQRTSGFMLWQSEYTEYIFMNEHFPDFSPQIFEKCIEKYMERERRFGA